MNPPNAAWIATLALIAACASPSDLAPNVHRIPTRSLRLGAESKREPSAPPEGLPKEWHRFLGFDEIAQFEETEWTDDQLEAIASSTFHGTFGREAVLFELTLDEESIQQRWFVLIEEPSLSSGSISVLRPHTDENASDQLVVMMSSTTVLTTITEAGQAPAEAVETSVPTVPMRAGFPLLVNEAVIAAQERGSESAGKALSITRPRTSAALSLLLEAALAHPQLGPLLISVVDRPSLFSIVRHGGVVLDVHAPEGDVEPATVDWPGVGSLKAAAIPGVIMANGVRALEVEWLAVAPAEPLAFVSGIVHLSGRHPLHHDRTVQLRMIGARVIKGGSDSTRE